MRRRAAACPDADVTGFPEGRPSVEDATLAASVVSEARPGALEPGLVALLSSYLAGPLQLSPWFAPA
jgi:hypothetical protein